MYNYKVRLDRIIDADTISLVVDLGFHIEAREVFRLWGLNAPERYTPEGKAAISFVAAWFAGHAGFELGSMKAKSDQDKYGRWLAVIVGRDAGGIETNLNAELISTGHAVKYLTDRGLDPRAEEDD